MILSSSLIMLLLTARYTLYTRCTTQQRMFTPRCVYKPSLARRVAESCSRGLWTNPDEPRCWVGFGVLVRIHHAAVQNEHSDFRCFRFVSIQCVGRYAIIVHRMYVQSEYISTAACTVRVFSRSNKGVLCLCLLPIEYNQSINILHMIPGIYGVPVPCSTWQRVPGSTKTVLVAAAATMSIVSRLACQGKTYTTTVYE